MSNRRTAKAVLAAALLGLPASAQASEPLRPVAEVRTLVRSQDGLAHGKRGSADVQRLMIGRISHVFRRAPPETWSDRANAIAAIKYLMSGGDPTFAENDAVLAAVPKPLQPLMLATLAYARGLPAKARRLFAAIDPRELDPALAGHAALIKSLLTFTANPKVAMEYLDDARLLGTGTLVEEAAIRRQLGVVVDRRDHDRFQRLTMRYVRKFQRSVYAAAFREHLATGLTHESFEMNEARSAWLTSLLDHLDRSVRPTYCMAIAERGLVKGRAKLVKIAASRVEADAGANSGHGARARLFKAAVEVVDRNGSNAVAELNKMQRFPAGSFEDNLRQAALALAKGIAKPVERSDAASAKAVKAAEAKTYQER